jgi:hypothetical protein
MLIGSLDRHYRGRTLTSRKDCAAVDRDELEAIGYVGSVAPLAFLDCEAIRPWSEECPNTVCIVWASLETASKLR